MIEFQSIKTKNFLSVGNNPVEILLNKSPTTCISGRNGSGKSLILDGINFALFGKPYRKINKPDLVNSINGKGLEVELLFTSKSKQYKIVRGIKPNILEIYEDSKLLNQASDSRDYQEFLETNILGMNENAFKQIVLIGSANYVPFMQLDTSKRREVIEDLLDIKIFSTMNILLKGKLSSIKETLRDLDSKYSVLVEKKRFFEDQNTKQQEEDKNKKINLEEDLRNNQVLLDTIESEFERLTTLVIDMTSKLTDQYDKDIEKNRKLKYTLEGRSKTEEDNKTFFSHHDSCPTCKQDIESTYKTDMISAIDKTLEKYNSLSEDIQITLDGLNKLSLENTKLKNDISNLKNSLSNLLADKRTYTSTKTRLEKELKDLSSSSTKNLTDISVIDGEILTIKTLYTQQDTVKQRFEIVQKLLKDDGIKAKIIEQYIPQINFHVNEYLNKLGLPIQFTLDENFDEIIQSRYRDKFKYANFSEGEKCRIDNALLLTWREIAKAKNTTNTNLLFLDEVFDSSLDSNATEEFLNILTNYGSGTNIFIISHKADLTSKVRSVIEMEKHGNFSRIKPNTTSQGII